MTKYKRNIVIIFITFLVCKIMFSIYAPIYIGDDIWRYTCSLYISEGKIIYRDFNNVCTPFYYFLYAIPLLINKNMLMFRLMDCFIYVLFFVILYKISNLIYKNEYSRYLLIIMQSAVLCLISYDYNIIAYLLFLYGFFIIIKDKKINKTDAVLLGIICSLMVLTKQTIGVIFTLSLVAIYFIYIKQKEKKHALIYITTILICACTFIYYLVMTNSINAFFDQCVFGAKGFLENNVGIIEKIQKSKLHVLILEIVIVLYNIYYTLFKTKKNKIYTIINLSSLIYLFPIRNFFHILIVLLHLSISFIYLLDDANLKVLKDNKYIIFINAVIITLILGFIFKPDTIKIKNNYLNNYVPKQLYTQIEPIIQYISQTDKKIYSIDQFYSFIEYTQNRQPNEMFYVFNNGSFGKTDPVQIIECTEDDAYFYLLNDETLILWQTPKDVRKYIIDTYKIIEQQEKFTLYKK